VFLQRHAAPRRQMVSMQLIYAHQVRKVLHQQPRLAGRCKTLMPHCPWISMTDKELDTLLWRAYKFCVRAAANSCKSGEPILHIEHPHISHCFLTGDLKNLKSIGVP
jgi:hypothetical protein